MSLNSLFLLLLGTSSDNLLSLPIESVVDLVRKRCRRAQVDYPDDLKTSHVKTLPLATNELSLSIYEISLTKTESMLGESVPVLTTCKSMSRNV